MRALPMASRAPLFRGRRAASSDGRWERDGVLGIAPGNARRRLLEGFP